MDILTQIQNILAIPWVAILVFLELLIAGWILCRILAKIAVRFLSQRSFFLTLTTRFGEPAAGNIGKITEWTIRLAVFLLLTWQLWAVLSIHPQIDASLEQITGFVSGVLSLPFFLLALELLLLGAATFALWKALGWIQTGFSGLADQLDEWQQTKHQGIRFQKALLISTEQLSNIIRTIVRLLQYSVFVLLVLVYLGLIFSIFPETRGVVIFISRGLLEAASREWANFTEYLPSLMTLLLILFLTYFGLRLMRFIFREIGKGTISIRGFYADWADPTYHLARIFVIAFALVLSFPYLPGSSSPAFQGISIFLGFLLSLGSSSVVANILSGIVLTYTRAFRIGDRVDIGGSVGDITEKGLLVTRLRTIKNVIVSIPNAAVLGSHIQNYSAAAKTKGLILHTTITLGYAIPWPQAHKTLIRAALATEYILQQPKPFILQTSLDNNYVSYELNAYTNQPNRMADIHSSLHLHIQDACREDGIEILSPQYHSLRDGNQSAIPPQTGELERTE